MTTSPQALRIGPVSVFFGAQSGKYPDGNQLLVHGSDTLVAFDTPMVANQLQAQLGQVDLVVLGHVHEDHMAGLHLMPGVPVQVPLADLAAAQSWDGLAAHFGYSHPVLEHMHRKIRDKFHYAPRPDATGYDNGQRWDLGGVQVSAVHLPGHTSGHTALLVEPDGVLFIGDIDLSGFGPYYGDATSCLADFRRTLVAVAQVPASTWVTSHHKGVIHDRATFEQLLAAFGARLDQRSAAIEAALSVDPMSLEQLVDHRFVYPRGYDEMFVDDVERRTISQHLDELVGQQRVAFDGERFSRR